MNLILLSGGSGKRLWPLSNDVRSKQFIKVFQKEDGTYESMIQRMYRQIRLVDAEATVTIATSELQVPAIHNQLDDSVNISLEPYRRDTFPAIALAVAYLHDVERVSENEPVVVCPVDPYVEADYFASLKELADLVEADTAQLMLLEMETVEPSEKFGYIIPASSEAVSPVQAFKEKPDTETASAYIRQGALWNGGVFAFKLGYMWQRAHELIDFESYEDLFDKYESLPKISFDYAVVEHEADIAVKRFAGKWQDLGTWNALVETMNLTCVGEVMQDDACENICVVNELDAPVVCMGIKDVIVAASSQGILVADKGKTEQLKTYVDRLEQEVMFAEQEWGSYLVLDSSKECQTIRFTVLAGRTMEYSCTGFVYENWTLVSGKACFLDNDNDGSKDGTQDGTQAPQVWNIGETLPLKTGNRLVIRALEDARIVAVRGK